MNNGDSEYFKWKRKHVTYRGMKEIGQSNGVSGMLGRGLYTVPRSNIALAKTYGKLYFVVNGKPQFPKVFNGLNEWEIWFQNNLVLPCSIAKGETVPHERDFYEKTTIQDEVRALGFDGVEIQGREMVNFNPKDVMYFSTERELRNWFEESKRLGHIK